MQRKLLFRLVLPASISHTDPVTLLAFLGYKIKEANGRPEQSGYVTTAYIFLALYATKWFSNRWRNGLLPQKRLNKETWKEEIVLVTGGAQGKFPIAKSKF